LQTEVGAFPIDRPDRGTWENLGLQVVHAFGHHRPAVDPAALGALKALIAHVIEKKAASLESMPDRQDAYRETRRCWGAG
jgi:hypothetical protein